MKDITVRFWTGPQRFQHFKHRAEALGLHIMKEENKETLFIVVKARNIREATNIVYDALEDQ